MLILRNCTPLRFKRLSTFSLSRPPPPLPGSCFVWPPSGTIVAFLFSSFSLFLFINCDPPQTASLHLSPLSLFLHHSFFTNICPPSFLVVVCCSHAIVSCKYLLFLSLPLGSTSASIQLPPPRPFSFFPPTNYTATLFYLCLFPFSSSSSFPLYLHLEALVFIPFLSLSLSIVLSIVRCLFCTFICCHYLTSSFLTLFYDSSLPSPPSLPMLDF